MIEVEIEIASGALNRIESKEREGTIDCGEVLITDGGKMYIAELEVDLYTFRGTTLTDRANLLKTHAVSTPTRQLLPR